MDSQSLTEKTFIYLFNVFFSGQKVSYQFNVLRKNVSYLFKRVKYPRKVLGKTFVELLKQMTLTTLN